MNFRIISIQDIQVKEKDLNEELDDYIGFKYKLVKLR